MNETISIVGGLAFAVSVVALIGLIWIDRETRRRKGRIARAATATGGRAYPPVGKVPERRASALDHAADAEVFQWLECEIRLAGLRLSPLEVLVQIGIASFAIYAIGVLVLSTSPLLTAVVSVVTPVACAALVLRVSKTRRMAAFSDGVPEALDVFARGLKAGRPVADSISVVVDNSVDPIRSEFARCQDELRLGTSLPDSLERLCRRMPTPEVRFFAVATALQGQTGGNLVETMENLAAQLRDRRKLKKKGRALSSEARASAVILAGLPFTVGMAIALLNPDYLEPLYADPRGQMMSMIALSSIGLGIFMMIRMGKLHV